MGAEEDFPIVDCADIEASDVTLRRPTAFDVVRTIVGAVLLIAAAFKGYELATGPLAGDGWLAWRPLPIGLVELEFLLGLWLLSGLRPKTAWWAAIFCFGVFTAYTLYRALAGYESCGCFGKVQVNPWYTLVLDSTVMAALLVFRPTSSHTGPANPRARLGWVGVVALAIGLPGLLAMGGFKAAAIDETGAILGDGNFVVLEPESWIDNPFPLADHIEFPESLRHGRWVTVFYRHDCSHCVQALPGYERLASQWRNEQSPKRLALIEMPPYAESDADPVRQDTACIRGKLKNTRDWFVQTPAEIELADGVVVAAKENASPDF